jgi:tetratricopeptide (TPR) repeat protein/predicted Ser/Thr protein kinase
VIDDEARTTLRGAATWERGVDGPGPQRGDAIGRYVVLDRIGHGGTGEVLRAYDPELDRRVAIKLLRDSGDSTADQARLLAEARALAKLQHPNIVAVHDVGVHDGRVFMAMAHVDGMDLAAWIVRKPGRDEVLEVLAKAGQGIAAAHAAGLVHGDIKPSNVLVANDGGVFVVDFGLATPLGDADEHVAGAPPGTPLYLAPELYAGARPNAKSDLYAFATMTFEMVGETPPWTGADEHALLLAKRRGPPSMPAVVPRSLRGTLRRALHPDPYKRPDLAELLAWLKRSRMRWKLGLFAASGVAGMAASLAIVWTRDPCPPATDRAELVWSATSRAAARAGVLESGAPHAEETWPLVEASLDEYVQGWIAAHHDACEATHVRREQSPELLERIHVCLDRRLHQVDVLAELLAKADRSVVDEAARAAAKLPALGDCHRTVVIDAPGEPTGPEADRIRGELDRVEVLESVAAYDDAMTLVRAAEDAATDLPSLRLEARYRAGRLLDLVGDHDAALVELQRVHWDAEEAGRDTIAALAGIYVVYELAAVTHRPDEALAWAPHVRASIARAGADPLQLAALDENVGVAHLYRLEHDRALALFRQTLEVRERVAGESSLPVVSSLNNLGIALEETKSYDEAIAVQRRALDIVAAQVGAHHPHTARVHDNLGTALLRSGRIAEAVEHFETALVIRRDALDDDHRSIAMSFLHLGLAAVEAENWALAVAHYRRALAIYLESFPEGDRNVLLVHEGLAHAYAGGGRWDAALEHARIAVRGLEPMLGAEHSEIRGLHELIARAPRSATATTGD